ncbi:ladinin-1 isoform X1 [Tamandua tetradactyla]
MSVSRKDWSALSSLARQRTLEDEEEQERERRRRHRNLSAAVNDDALRPTQNGDQPAAERLPSVEEAEVFTPPPSASKDEDEDFQAVLRTRRERRQRRQVVEAAEAPSQERIEPEEGRDSSGPGQIKQQAPRPKKELDPPPRRRLSQEQRGPWAREEESLVGGEPGRGKKEAPEKAPEKISIPEKTLAFEKRLISEKTSISEKVPAPEKTPVSEKIAISEKRSISEKKSVPEKTSISEKMPSPEKTSSSERKRVSEKASIFEKLVASEKTQSTGTKLAPKKASSSEQPQAQESPACGESRPITKEQRRRGLPEETPPPAAELGEQRELDTPNVASRLPPFTLQVKIPSKEKEGGVVSPTQVTYSSSLKRSSSRTISFRMSPRKDNSETTLTRSASVRLPASTVKLGEKLERYHTAIQRSESVKSSGPSRAEFFVAPMGVASKRHIFEKELAGQSGAEPASSRKENLRLSGIVTSRLNLWISKTQESGCEDSQV